MHKRESRSLSSTPASLPDSPAGLRSSTIGARIAALGTLAVVAAASCLPQAAPQAPLLPAPQSSAQRLPQSPAVEPITLGIVVTDSAGQPVSGLRRQDFTILDEQKPSPILGFHAVAPPRSGQPAEDEPAQAIFVLDEVNMTFMDASRALAQLVSFFRKGEETLRIPASVLVLTDTTANFSGSPSRDARAVAADLEKQTPTLRSIRRSSAFYGDLERLDLSLRALSQLGAYESVRPGRKQVIWISSGWPYLAGPSANYSAKQRQSNFATVVALSTRLRKAGITLYSVDPRGTDDAGGFETTYYRGFLKGVRTAGDTTLSNLGLQVLAAQSGGLVLNSSNDVRRELATCFNDVSSYYVISVASSPAEQVAQYHAFTVKLAGAGLTARTRAGYYALPAQP